MLRKIELAPMAAQLLRKFAAEAAGAGRIERENCPAFGTEHIPIDVIGKSELRVAVRAAMNIDEERRAAFGIVRQQEPTLNRFAVNGERTVLDARQLPSAPPRLIERRQASLRGAIPIDDIHFARRGYRRRGKCEPRFASVQTGD